MVTPVTSGGHSSNKGGGGGGGGRMKSEGFSAFPGSWRPLLGERERAPHKSQSHARRYMALYNVYVC